MTLARSEQAVYREFAIERINKGFLPADFATNQNTPTAENTQKEADTAVAETTVDLAGQRYLFTGKMQSMSVAMPKSWSKRPMVLSVVRLMPSSTI